MRFLANCLLIGSIFIIASIFVNACSCAMLGSPEESLQVANAVFSGRVVSVEMPQGFIQSSVDPVRVTFEVDRFWKGPAFKEREIITPRSSASCGYYFNKGKSYLVYTYFDKESQEEYTGICSRTKLVDDAKEDFEVIGVGRIPDQEGSSVSAKEKLQKKILPLGIVAIIVFFAYILI